MTVDAGTRFADILLVEDNAQDVELTQLALDRAGVSGRLHVARDGEEAMSFLRREAPFESAPRPDLVLLDLNMPRKDGRQVLDEIKHDPELHRIPVVVLTTSEAESDVMASYDLHCNSYLVKPIGLDALTQTVRTLADYWFSVVCLPPSPAAVD